MEKKRYRMTFKAVSGFFKRVVYSYCVQDELEQHKEDWAMIIEEETGYPVVCCEIVEVK